MSPDKIRRLHTPEELGFTFQLANKSDLSKIEDFLSRKDIDALFIPPLSDTTRGISIKERVINKFNIGFWIVSLDLNQKVVGSMAVVPTQISEKPIKVDKKTGIDISLGISISEWDVEKIMELSTVATDPVTKNTFSIKGIGKNLLLEAIKEVGTKKGKIGLITDSWLGGEMDGFITHVINNIENKPPTNQIIDLLIRIYSDPPKRGSEGLPTALYLIPCNSKDWNFLVEKQDEIKKLREQYQLLQTKNS